MDRRSRASSSSWSQRSRQTHQRLSLSAESTNSCSPGFLSAVFSDASNGEPGILKRGAFRHLTCTSAPDVYIPATAASVIRASADWEPKSTRRARGPRRRSSQVASSSSAMSSSVRARTRANAYPDLWCSGHLPLTADTADPMDALVPAGPASSSRLHRGIRGQDSAPPIAISSMGGRNFGEFNDLVQHGIDAALGPSICEMAEPFIVLPRRHLRSLHGLYYTHENLTEDLDRSMGRPDMSDRFREWRLDVDDMSYEELIELGDQIGYVKTGLKEDEITVCVEKMKQCTLEREWRCCICLEEYSHEKNEFGKLECGHEYHVCCIDKWLRQKSICPVCKATVSQFKT